MGPVCMRSCMRACVSATRARVSICALACVVRVHARVSVCSSMRGRMHLGECMCVCVCVCACVCVCVCACLRACATLTDALNDFAQIASPSTLYLSGARGSAL
jgi:hypothetical protein